MLSPYTEPYYPETAKILRKAGMPVKTENVGHKPTDKKQTENNKRKDMEQNPTKEKINIEYPEPEKETISKPEHTEWIKVRGNSSTVISDKH